MMDPCGAHAYRAIRALALFGLLSLLQACAAFGDVNPDDRDVSLAYGYIDMEQLPSDLEWLQIRDYSGANDPYYAAIKDGLFWHIGLKPGSYQVNRFGGTGGIPLLTAREFEYDFGGSGRNATALRIESPGAYYMGSYQGVLLEGGWFKADKFEMQPVEEPSESELLERIVQHMESTSMRQYTYQIGMAKRRLEELR